MEPQTPYLLQKIGYFLTQSDATSAYTQEFIGGGRGKGVPNMFQEVLEYVRKPKLAILE